jgi:hypothetical protein
MPFIESTSKFSSGLSLLYISFDNLLEFRIVLIDWLLYSDLLKSFFELKTKEKIPLNVDSIIWYNSSLKIEGKTIFYKELFDNN